MFSAADLDRPSAYEILSGPYPHYLDRWHVRDRFADAFSATQLDALYDWSGRGGRRLVMDEAGFRLLPMSEWFTQGRSEVVDGV